MRFRDLAATEYACGANSEHGYRRTNKDKRRAVETLLQKCKSWSDRRIAEAAKVSDMFVGKMRGATQTVCVDPFIDPDDMETLAEVEQQMLKDRELITAEPAEVVESDHGYRRTNKDKRRAVETLLRKHPKWSDVRIADAAKVGQPFVSRLRGATILEIVAPRIDPADRETLAEVEQKMLKDRELITAEPAEVVESDHGYRRTNKDKRRAVGTLLHLYSEDPKSDQFIADLAKVDRTFVLKVRNQLVTVTGSSSPGTIASAPIAPADLPVMAEIVAALARFGAQRRSVWMAAKSWTAAERLLR